MLLISLTAFAIGFPVWYRWPYSEEVLQYPETKGRRDESRPSVGRAVVSWQRQWGGGRLQHGVTAFYREDGTIAYALDYRRGKKHGRQEWYREDESLGRVEEYADGTQIRITKYSWDDAIDYRAETVGRFLHGKAVQHLRDGPVVVWQFDHGRVVARNNEPIPSGLFDALAAGRVEKRLAERLRLVTPDPVYAATPKEELEQLAEFCGVPLVIENAETLEWIEPQFSPRGIDYPSALVMKARALGRQCDYRDNRVWITSQSKESQSSETQSSSLNQP